MNAFSKYYIFCRVVELHSFTAAATELGYTQSAVSQIVRALETELGVVLLERRRDGVRLTADGKAFMPFLMNLAGAELALRKKQEEMEGLTDSTIVIGTFTSVSRTILPPLMAAFRREHPGVSFVLRQGEYVSIHDDIVSDRIDLGFITPDNEQRKSIEMQKLYDDDMVAVLPPGHDLCSRSKVELKDLAGEPFILMDEGERYSTVLEGFRKRGLEPTIAYEVYDDYSILAMIQQNLGVSILFRRVVEGFSEGVEIRELSDRLRRPVYLAWKSRETMPLAARRFSDFIVKSIAEGQN
ncbi:MAG: LysR family transcriptional regulator [Eubacterium sp.]|nr:LysR family transcriptional regulator [Eubacterium sp.]